MSHNKYYQRTNRSDACIPPGVFNERQTGEVKTERFRPNQPTRYFSFYFPYVSTIQIYKEIPNEPQNIAHSIQKCDLPLHRPGLESLENPIWGSFVEEDQCHVYDNWQKHIH